MIDSLKNLLIEVLSKQAYTALIAIPGFGWVFALPVVRQVVQFVITSVVSWAVRNTAVGLSLLWIQVDLSYEVDSAETAAAKLRDMLENPTKYAAKEQKQIEEHFDETTIDLIQLSIKRL